MTELLDFILQLESYIKLVSPGLRGITDIVKLPTLYLDLRLLDMIEITRSL
jgi:hypothetical protein